LTFEQLGLPTTILDALTAMGHQEPTAIQKMAIPEAMQGHDLMASAQTGTGKTAAFILPALARIATPDTSRSRGPRTLVLTPTRELATQVADAAKSYGKNMRISVVTVVGGMPYQKQTQMLSRPVDILVATPGRLMDLMNRGRLDFSRLEILILDEADRMLDMGFVDDIKQIAAQLPPERQTLLFSATLDGTIARIAKELLRAPKRIQATEQTDRHANIDQSLLYVDDFGHKNRLLSHLLTDEALTQAVIFTATKGSADELADSLHDQGYKAAALHGDMSQNMRNHTITRLRRGAIQLLVATDVAARGIDVSGISHVFNFDLPRDIENYVHRIGRTGRAGASGMAISFASAKERGLVKRIESFTGQTIETRVIAGFEPRRQAERPSSASNRSKRSDKSRRSFGGARQATRSTYPH
jgi:superfamily II DNA/RNA helicase